MASTLETIIFYGALIIYSLIFFFLLYWRLWFLRDPQRISPKGRTIVSPADGKILKIATIKKPNIKVDKGYLGKIYTATKNIAPETRLISIFMSPLDVHYNRVPVDGKVLSINHTKGTFFAANNLEKSLQNEKNEVLIENRQLGKVKVIQVAGFLARRISCYVTKNQNVIKGEKLGLINLGSQCVLILPKKIRIRVKQGQQVYGGITIIGDY